MATWASALAAMAGLAGPVQAQNLQVLYGVARSHDATYLAAQLQADAAEHKAEQSRALNRPSVTATVGSTATHSQTPWNSISRSTTQQNTVGLTLEMTLFNRAHDKTQAQGELAVAVARAQMQAAEHDLMMRVAQAYFDVLTAADALTSVQMGKRAIVEQVGSARNAFRVGTVTITDAREAEARLDLARAQELAAENELHTAQLALGQLVGRNQLSPKPLAKPVRLPELLPPDAEEWVRIADDHNPGLRQLRLARLLSRLDTEKAQAAGLPTVSANAALQWVQGRVEGHNKATDGSTVAFGPNTGTGPNASLGLQLSMPLYAGGAIQGRVKETLSLEQKSEAELEAARRNVAQATRAAFYGVRSLLARVAALEAAEASSALALDAIRTGYQVGVRVNLDVLNAQTQHNQAQRDLARARYDVIVLLLRLRQTAGVLQTQDMAGISQLLER